jgi:hypothetical protein
MTNPFRKLVGPYCIAMVRFPAETGWAWVVGSQQDPCARRVAWEARRRKRAAAPGRSPGPYAGRDLGRTEVRSGSARSPVPLNAPAVGPRPPGSNPGGPTAKVAGSTSMSALSARCAQVTMSGCLGRVVVEPCGLLEDRQDLRRVEEPVALRLAGLLHDAGLDQALDGTLGGRVRDVQPLRGPLHGPLALVDMRWISDARTPPGAPADAGNPWSGDPATCLQGLLSRRRSRAGLQHCSTVWPRDPQRSSATGRGRFGRSRSRSSGSRGPRSS